MTDYKKIISNRKETIMTSTDNLTVTGKKYYVSNSGNDSNDGLSPESAWCSLEKVSSTELNFGDGVFFERGSVFRGKVIAQSGVTYAAYGKGAKPKLYGSELSLADPSLWEMYDKSKNIWVCTRKSLDVGTLVFENGKFHSRKLIPSYKNNKFVCRDDEKTDFVISNEMKKDLDLFWDFTEILTTQEYDGENFPVPDTNANGKGTLYLRCDNGNPGEVFNEIEALPATHMFRVGNCSNVTIDNLCVKFVGRHGVCAGGHSIGLHVSNCEFGWIGGVIQNYLGTDPNYPEGKRGSVTRYGNAVEIYGGCEDYNVTNNYIYEVYDAGITHQITTSKKVVMKDILYSGNLIEKCVYGIEYFLDQIDGDTESYMDNVQISDNIITLSGYGWGQQRHNVSTPAAIKGWSYRNTAKKFIINNNIFDRCAYRLLHLVAFKNEFCPKLDSNTYIQYNDYLLGQYGANENGEPEIHKFNRDSEKIINDIFGDKHARLLIKEQDK